MRRLLACALALVIGLVAVPDAQRRRFPKSVGSTAAASTDAFAVVCNGNTPNDSALTNVDVLACANYDSQANIDANDDQTMGTDTFWVYHSPSHSARGQLEAFPTFQTPYTLVNAITSANDGTTGNTAIVVTKTGDADPGNLSIDAYDSLRCDTEIIRMSNAWTNNSPVAGQVSISNSIRGYDAGGVNSVATTHTAGTNCYASTHNAPQQLTINIANASDGVATPMAYGYVYAFLYYENLGTSFLKSYSPGLIGGGAMLGTKQSQFRRGGSGGLTYEPNINFSGVGPDNSTTATCFNGNTHVGTRSMRMYGSLYDGMSAWLSGRPFRLGPNTAVTADDHFIQPVSEYCQTAGKWTLNVALIELVNNDWARYWHAARGETDSSFTWFYDGVQIGFPAAGDPASGPLTPPDRFNVAEMNTSSGAYQLPVSCALGTCGHGMTPLVLCYNKTAIMRSAGTITTSGLTKAIVEANFLSTAPPNTGTCS